MLVFLLVATEEKRLLSLTYIFVHISYDSLFFIKRREEPPVCISCDKLLTTEHILLFCSDFIEAVEWNVTAWSVRMFSDMFRLHFQ